MLRNVIFDWSGTLVDDLPAVLQATNQVFRLAGVAEMSADQFRAEFCLPFAPFYARYVPHVPLPQLEQWFHAEFGHAQHAVTPLPHARAFLRFCRDHALRTFLLSSVHRAAYASQSAALELDGFIDHPYVEVWDKRARIQGLLAEHRLDPRETLFIGDMQHDIETAHAGGVHSCAVLTGYNRLDQLRAAAPELIVEHLGELQELLERGRGELALPTGAGLTPPAPASPVGPVATVGALIQNDRGEVLLVRTQKWSGLWGIPGGKIKFGEPSEVALLRELKEETGLDVTDIRFVLVQDCIHSAEFYRDAHFILLNYTCRVIGPPVVVLNEEAEEYRWVAYAAAGTLALNQPTRVLLQAVVKNATFAPVAASWI